ncbi:hypothetical protein Y032_0651g1146 [Ancylostoma ceylanicum]|uniref:SXP/RAL-2 family protein Ani s 5-like cation-binding domain-containing protein n=1 Tax=Ancylostoma ceylanicum TaxID=53326 RepID=A0A016WJY5_9BILA|nr:hypothetical protein Y032_0651g1146 [Ancylostoma ceylanicum]
MILILAHFVLTSSVICEPEPGSFENIASAMKNFTDETREWILKAAEGIKGIKAKIMGETSANKSVKQGGAQAGNNFGIGANGTSSDHLKNFSPQVREAFYAIGDAKLTNRTTEEQLAELRQMANGIQER